MNRALLHRAKHAPRKSVSEIVQKSASQSVPDYFRDLEARDMAETKVRDPYSASVWVHAAINHVATPIKEAALEFLDAPRGGEPIESPEVEQFWRAPAKSRNGALSLYDLIHLIVGLRACEGVAYLVIDDSWITASNPAMKRPLAVASRRQLKPVYDGMDLRGWRYTDRAGRTRFYLPEQVIALRRISIGNHDDADGVGNVEAAKTHVDSEVAGAKHAKQLMDRNGDSGQYIIAKGPAPSEPQKEWLLAQVEDKRRAAALGKVKDVVLGGDIEIQTPTLQGVEGAFLGQQEWDAKTIFNAFCLPTSLIESAASYSIGSASDLFRAMHNVVMPEGAEITAAISLVSEYFTGRRSLAQEINEGFRRAIESPIYARFSFDRHPVMIQWKKEQIESAKENLWSTGWSWEKINEYFDLGMSEFPGWDVAYVPAMLLPVEADGSAGASTPGSADGGDDGNRSAGDLLGDTSELLRQFSEQSTERKAQEARAEAEEKRREQWARLDRRRAPFRNRVSKGVSKRLMDARKETLENLAGLYDEEGNLKAMTGVETRSAFLDIVFDVTKFTDRLLAFFRAVWPEGYKDSVKGAAEEVAADFDDDTVGQIAESPRILELIRERENYMRNTSAEIHRQILDEIAAGVEAGESQAKMEARIRARFNDISRHRASTIATTETGAVYETARLETFRAAGITLKGWLTSQDDRVRDSHREAERKYADGIPLDDFFEVGRAKLLFPLDSANAGDAAEEVINCRCILIAIS